MTTTSIPTAAYVPAAALATAAVLPSCTPKRRLLTVLSVAATRAWVDEMIEPETFYFISVSDTGVLTKDTEHLLNRTASSLLIGLAALPAVGLVRLLPVGRWLGAAALAGGYVAGDRWLRRTNAARVSAIRASSAA